MTPIAQVATARVKTNAEVWRPGAASGHVRVAVVRAVDGASADAERVGDLLHGQLAQVVEARARRTCRGEGGLAAPAVLAAPPRGRRGVLSEIRSLSYWEKATHIAHWSSPAALSSSVTPSLRERRVMPRAFSSSPISSRFLRERPMRASRSITSPL